MKHPHVVNNTLLPWCKPTETPCAACALIRTLKGVLSLKFKLQSCSSDLNVCLRLKIHYICKWNKFYSCLFAWLCTYEAIKSDNTGSTRVINLIITQSKWKCVQFGTLHSSHFHLVKPNWMNRHEHGSTWTFTLYIPNMVTPRMVIMMFSFLATDHVLHSSSVFVFLVGFFLVNGSWRLQDQQRTTLGLKSDITWHRRWGGGVELTKNTPGGTLASTVTADTFLTVYRHKFSMKIKSFSKIKRQLLLEWSLGGPAPCWTQLLLSSSFNICNITFSSVILQLFLSSNKVPIKLLHS